MAARSGSSSNIWTWLLLSIVVIGTLVLTFVMLVEAPPPLKIVMATGSKEGAYYRYAQRYAELLKQEGVTLEIRSTKGSVENLKLLNDEDSDVYVALVQSGIADPAKCEKLESLCSLYREPLWIFYRGTETIDRLTHLAGKKVAIGPEGSGTRAIAQQLLQANEIDDTQAELVPISGNDAAQALHNGEVDAAFFVAGMDAVSYTHLTLPTIA